MRFLPSTIHFTSADGQRRLGKGLLYQHKVTSEEDDMWKTNQGSLSAVRERWTGGEDPVVDVSRDDWFDNLKVYLNKHGVPPAGFFRGDKDSLGADDLDSFAVIRPTQEQLGSLDLSQSRPGSEWLRAEIRNRSVNFSKEPFNTTVHFSCQGKSLSLTSKGWMLYEGEMECGLHVPTESKELVSNFYGLGKYLRDLEKENSAESRIDLQLQMRLTDANDQDLPRTDVCMELVGDPEGARLPPGMARRTYDQTTLDSFIESSLMLDEPSEPPLQLLGYGGQDLRSEEFIFLRPESRQKALRTRKGTKIMATRDGVFQKDFDRRDVFAQTLMSTQLICRLPTV